MGKIILKFSNIIAFMLCFALLFGNISVMAAEETTGMEDSEVPENVNKTEELSLDELTIQGIEGVNISEIKDITPSSTKISCGGEHKWNILNVIQQGTCTEQGIYKVECSNCGATGVLYCIKWQ